MSQTTYNANFAKAFEGLLADVNNMDTLSKVGEGAIGFGLGVVQGTLDEQAKAPTVITQKVLGVSIHKHIENGDTLDKRAFGVLRKGRIWVKVEEDVVAGDDVFMRAVITGVEVAGAFRASADSTDCIDLSTKCEFRTSALAGELAVLDVNFK